MPTYAPNIELLYTQHADFADRIRAAAADGFDAVEMWMTSVQDVDALAAAAKEAGVRISSVLAEPRFSFNMPGVDLEVFYQGLRESIERAKKLGAPRLVLGSGMGFPGKKRIANLDGLVAAFREAVKIADAADIDLVLEPVNTRVDHPGALLDRTEEAIYVVEQVGSPRLTILYDVYHSTVEGEDVLAMLDKYRDKIGYIQIADHPGRGEAGTGIVDWPTVLKKIDEIGYTEVVGLEFYPTKDTTQSLTYLRSL